MNFQPVKGTHDLFGEEMIGMQYVIDVLSATAELYAYKRISTPVLEYTEVFSRGTGGSSDIVRKEMYTFNDKGDRSVTMRPEFTAGVARAIVEHKLYATEDLPIKCFYYGPVFRYERPQLGRYRQFHQFGVEEVGLDSSRADAECICLAVSALQMLGFENVKLKINSLGDNETRAAYREALVKYFSEHIDEMCDDCKERIKLNPLRILDCKVEHDQEIAKGSPRVTDFLNESDQKEFSDIKRALDALDIEYVVDSELVRGLDYYTGLVWELYDTLNDSLGAIGGGGKYASLMASIGGPDFEGIGFSLGVERLMIALTEERKAEIKKEKPLDVFIIDFKREGKANYFADKLRQSGLNVSIASFNRALGGALKMADRKGAKKVLIVDSDDTFKIKDMASRNQIEVKEEEVLSSLGE